jgi:hypothetical protein
MYVVAAYLSLMCLLMYLCSFIRNPVAKFGTAFPSECLGQSFKDSEPIESVCRRLSPTNPYHFPNGSLPAGFQVSPDSFIMEDI